MTPVVRGSEIRAATTLGGVIEIEDVPPLANPIVIAAFEGWNDAADAASSVVDHLLQVWNARVIGAIDPEDFYDFQMNRPLIGADERGMRGITWPSTQIALASPAGLGRDVILIRGIEPNMRWRQFCAELLAACDDLGAAVQEHQRQRRWLRSRGTRRLETIRIAVVVGDPAAVDLDELLEVSLLESHAQYIPGSTLCPNSEAPNICSARSGSLAACTRPAWASRQARWR